MFLQLSIFMHVSGRDSSSITLSFLKYGCRKRSAEPQKCSRGAPDANGSLDTAFLSSAFSADLNLSFFPNAFPHLTGLSVIAVKLLTSQLTRDSLLQSSFAVVGEVVVRTVAKDNIKDKIAIVNNEAATNTYLMGVPLQLIKAKHHSCIFTITNQWIN